MVNTILRHFTLGWHDSIFVCVHVLRPAINKSLMSGRVLVLLCQIRTELRVKCTQGHTTSALVSIELKTLRSRVLSPTTEPPRSTFILTCI